MKHPTRRDIFKGGLAASLAGLAATVPGVASAQPGPAPLAWQPPQKQSGNRLNLVVLVSDTFRADNLEVYGSQWVDTPALNRFAKEAVVFEQFYPEGMPTVPIRRQLYTGRRIFPTHTYFQQSTNQSYGWHPQRSGEDTQTGLPRSVVDPRPRSRLGRQACLRLCANR